MEKILILADLTSASAFLAELSRASSERAVIISADERLFAPASELESAEIYSPAQDVEVLKRALAAGISSSNFTGYFADPTCAQIVAPFCAHELQIVYILLKDERRVRAAYDAVRAANARCGIVLASNDAAYENDAFCSAFSPRNLLAARLVDELPSTPHIARFIGLGSGEIMQVKVQAGSIYANKHIRAITQRDYKIALIYRKGAALLPERARLILPGDELLLVGEPARLRKIHARVRASLGQFPQPYAGRIAAVINMQHEREIGAIIKAALTLREKTNVNECDLVVINPTQGEDFALLRALRDLSNASQQGSCEGSAATGAVGTAGAQKSAQNSADNFTQNFTQNSADDSSQNSSQQYRAAVAKIRQITAELGANLCGVSVQFAYNTASSEAAITRLCARANYFFIASAGGFERCKSAYFAAHMPVLRLGVCALSELARVAALSENASGVEELSGVLLDFGAALGVASEIHLFCTDAQQSGASTLAEHCEEQSKFFGRKLLLRIFERENPLLLMARERESLCVTGFSESFCRGTSWLNPLWLASRIGRFLRPNIEANIHQLRKNHILFLPIN